jgi:hypothetical protein
MIEVITYEQLLAEASELLPRKPLIGRFDGFQLSETSVAFVAYRPFIPALADTGVMDYFWQHSTQKYYVPAGAEVYKLIEVVEQIEGNRQVRMPLANVFEGGNKLRVVFITGQYLFALMRNLGFRAIPVMITRESKTLFDKYIMATCPQLG